MKINNAENKMPSRKKCCVANCVPELNLPARLLNQIVLRGIKSAETRFPSIHLGKVSPFASIEETL